MHSKFFRVYFFEIECILTLAVIKCNVFHFQLMVRDSNNNSSLSTHFEGRDSQTTISEHSLQVNKTNSRIGNQLNRTSNNNNNSLLSNRILGSLLSNNNRTSNNNKDFNNNKDNNNNNNSKDFDNSNKDFHQLFNTLSSHNKPDHNK